MTNREQLVAETLGEANGAAFARRAAARVRRRRVLGRVSRVAGAMAVAAGLLYFAEKPAPVPAPAQVAAAPVVEIITDRQLMAELKDRPVLILRDQAGITGVVFLAETNQGSL